MGYQAISLKAKTSWYRSITRLKSRASPQRRNANANPASPAHPPTAKPTPKNDPSYTSDTVTYTFVVNSQRYSRIFRGATSSANITTTATGASRFAKPPITPNPDLTTIPRSPCVYNTIQYISSLSPPPSHHRKEYTKTRHNAPKRAAPPCAAVHHVNHSKRLICGRSAVHVINHTPRGKNKEYSPETTAARLFAAARGRRHTPTRTTLDTHTPWVADLQRHR